MHLPSIVGEQIIMFGFFSPRSVLRRKPASWNPIVERYARLCATCILALCVFIPITAQAQADHVTHGRRLSAPNADKGYNPLAGVDQDGRITRVKLPENVRNPERWRYIPEGRLKPGNLLDRFLVSTFILPVVFFEEDVGAGGGFALTDIDFLNSRRRDHVILKASYTTEGQQRYFAHWLRWLNHIEVPSGGIAFEERSFLSVILDYEKTLTRRFFGLGAGTKEADETSYSDKVRLAEVALEGTPLAAMQNLVGRAGLRLESHEISNGFVSKVSNTAEAFPTLFAAGEEDLAFWLEAGLRLDGRDSPINPYKGGMIGISAELAPWRDGEPAAAIMQADGNYTFKVPALFHDGGDPNEENPPTDVLAFNSFLRWTYGELPYYLKPSLGGRDTLRGYIGNRWTDDAAWHASAEYRFWFLPRGITFTDAIRIERLGGALFYDAGSVAKDLSALGRSEIHDSWGGSLRLGFERSTQFRLDVGFSDEGYSITLAHGLSF